jgi:CDP-diacylglycerol--glycerol-3-phosphate 3-phosphatidyltransferase
LSTMLPKSIQNGFTRLIQPLIHIFSRLKVNPNWFTTLGLILNIGGALSFAIGARYGARQDLQFIGWGGFLILLGGLCDLLDGKIAREAGLTTRFGALYDSVLDRYSEVIMFLGMCCYLVAQGYFYESVFCFVALGGSTMVSYIRARAETLRVDCKIGLMQRPERIVWLGSGSMFCGLSKLVIDPNFILDYHGIHLFKPIYIFTIPIVIVAFLANYTSIQRMVHCQRLIAEMEAVSEQLPEKKQKSLI